MNTDDPNASLDSSHDSSLDANLERIARAGTESIDTRYPNLDQITTPIMPGAMKTWIAAGMRFWCTRLSI